MENLILCVQVDREGCRDDADIVCAAFADFVRLGEATNCARSDLTGDSNRSNNFSGLKLGLTIAFEEFLEEVGD
ncbi:hypothetical protein [Leptolyngbya ohadii]|uniref:hypothetical protein n=1 Tax=Leptolyngbya ohadii TaxID=1962290 RepID=UPI0034E2F165